MQIKIYRLFTQENNVILSPEVLRYLEQHVRDEEALRSVVAEYRRRQGARMGNLGLLKDILESHACAEWTYSVASQLFRETDRMAKYKFLRDRMERVPVPVYLLEEGCDGMVFGCYYRDKNGRDVLEDDGGAVQVNLAGCCEANAFVCENMFVGMQGTMCGDRFAVSSILLPRVEKRPLRRIERNMQILFFSDFRVNEINSGLLEKITAKMHADVAVLMGRLCPDRSPVVLSHLSRFEGRSDAPDIILCPHADDVYPSFLPKTLPIDRFKSASNPCTLDVGRSIGVVRDDVFRAKERGVFLGTDCVDSLVRATLSQYAFNPFGLPDLSIEALPDVLVVGQDFYPFVSVVENVLFVSCPSFRDEMSFVHYNLLSNTAQILSCKDVL